MQVVVGGRPVIERFFCHGQVGPPDLPQVMPGHQRDRADLDLSLLCQLYKGDRLLLLCLGKRIFQRGTAVANVLPSNALGAVEMSQSHIVKAIKNGGVYMVCTAHGKLLGLAPGRAGDELVGQQKVPRPGVDLHLPDGHPQGVGVALNGLVGEAPPHMCGLEEGEQIDPHLSPGVVQNDRLDGPVIHRGDIDAAALHEPPAKGHPLGGVVVAADHQHR